MSVANNGSVVANYFNILYYLDSKTGADLHTRRPVGDLLLSTSADASGSQIVAIDTKGTRPSHAFGVLLDRKGQEVWRMGDPEDAVRISPDGKRVLTDGEDAGFSIIDAANGKIIREVPLRKSDTLWNAWFCRGDSKVLACTVDCAAMFDAQGKQLWIYNTKQHVRSVGTSANGSSTAVLLGMDKQSLVLLDAKGKVRRTVGLSHRGEIRNSWGTVTLSESGDFIVLAGGASPYHYLALDGSGKQLWTKSFDGLTSDLSAKMLPRGFAVCVGSAIELVDRSGKTVDTIPVSDYVLPWDLSANGQYIAIALADTSVALYAVPKSLTAAPAPSKIFRYFDGRHYVAASLATLQKDEEWAKQGGHMPWRTDPLQVALANGGPWTQLDTSHSIQQARTGSKLIVRTPSRNVVLRLTTQQANSATVAISSSGKRVATLELKRPLGHWWYITTRPVSKRAK